MPGIKEITNMYEINKYLSLLKKIGKYFQMVFLLYIRIKSGEIKMRLKIVVNLKIKASQGYILPNPKSVNLYWYNPWQ